MPVPESVPVWLSELVDPLGPIPMPDLLRHCVYYPSAGVDGTPVKYLGRYFQSFVYVDYGVGEQIVLNDLPNFRGYDLIASRQVCQDELFPQGWRPPELRPEDGNPTRNAGSISRHLPSGPFSTESQKSVLSTARSVSACCTLAEKVQQHTTHCSTHTKFLRPSWH